MPLARERPSSRGASSLLALAALVALGLLAGCSGRTAGPVTRPVTLVSRDRAVDASLAAARRTLAAGDAEATLALLGPLITHAPTDPVAPLARVLLARAEIARGERAAARRWLEPDPHFAREEPTVRTARTLVSGLLDAREGAYEAALTRLAPLEGTLPDQGDTADLSCALAVAAAEREPARALRALVTLDALASRGVSWPAALDACDSAEARERLLNAVLARIETPLQLANALDGLPGDSSLRRLVALRLRVVAERVREIPRWLRWLADLPDDRGAEPPPESSDRPAEVIIGVLGPLQGPRATVGISLLRGAQLALERVARVRVVPVDEGDSPASVAAALDALALQGARAALGVSREELTAAAAITAQGRSIDLWLTAPLDDVSSTGPRIHVTGPSLSLRVAALAQAARRAAPRVSLVSDESVEVGELRDRVLDALADEGLLALSTSPAEALRNGALGTRARGPRSVALVLAGFGREERARLGARAAQAPDRWIFDARGGLPGGSGTWVGVRPGPGFEGFVTRYCGVVGEPPDESTLLAHDAAREALRFARRLAHDAPELPPPVLDPGGAFGLLVRTPNDTRPLPPDAPAAAARCPPSTPAAPARE